jgi:hypothetical protein
MIATVKQWPQFAAEESITGIARAHRLEFELR